MLARQLRLRIWLHITCTQRYSREDTARVLAEFRNHWRGTVKTWTVVSRNLACSR